jgi:hydroxylysine kinase
MISLASELAEPFERITTDAAARILDERYGIRGARLDRLDTEKDDSFRVDAAGGIRFVMKIAHPADDPLVVNLQTAALAHAADVDARLPLQRFLPTIDGEIEPVVSTGGKGATGARDRIVRVLTWLPGTLLFDAERTDAQLELFGATQARLTAALVDFRHPAAERRLVWDLAHLAELRPLVVGTPEPHTLERVIGRFESLTTIDLPRQVVHNDLNPGNVVTDAGSPAFITGILDFGDVVSTWRVADLAVSLSYLIPSTGDPWGPLLAVVAGYQRENPLTALELDALPTLVDARLAQRILIASWLGVAVPENREYLWRNMALSQAQLAASTLVDSSTIRERIRDAVGR